MSVHFRDCDAGEVVAGVIQKDIAFIVSIVSLVNNDIVDKGSSGMADSCWFIDAWH